MFVLKIKLNLKSDVHFQPRPRRRGEFKKRGRG